MKYVGVRGNTYLKIMIVGNQFHQVTLDMLALIWGQSIHSLQMMTNTKDGFPSGNWVGSHNGMLSSQGLVNIVGVASGHLVEVGMIRVRTVANGGEGSGKGFQESSPGGTDTVVDLIGAGENSITTGGRANLVDKGGVVGCDALKGDI